MFRELGGEADYLFGIEVPCFNSCSIVQHTCGISLQPGEGVTSFNGSLLFTPESLMILMVLMFQ